MLWCVDMNRLILPFEGDRLGTDFHAAYVALNWHRSEVMAQHAHQFWEIFLVLEGTGKHVFGEHALPLEAGHLVLVRPEDFHTLRADPGRHLHFINVTFRDALWTEFCKLAGLERELNEWSDSEPPPTALLKIAEQEQSANAFREILRSFIERPSRYALMRFWSVVMPALFTVTKPSEALSGQPLWFVLACQAMRQRENLRLGHAAMLELSGVTAAHLARTFRKYYGQTPTEYINALRLECAGLLLTTTNREILDVSHDSGFENLSHFYKLFSKHFGQTPNAFRLSTRTWKKLHPVQTRSND